MTLSNTLRIMASSREVVGVAEDAAMASQFTTILATQDNKLFTRKENKTTLNTSPSTHSSDQPATCQSVVSGVALEVVSTIIPTWIDLMQQGKSHMLRGTRRLTSKHLLKGMKSNFKTVLVTRTQSLRMILWTHVLSTSDKITQEMTTIVSIKITVEARTIDQDIKSKKIKEAQIEAGAIQRETHTATTTTTATYQTWETILRKVQPSTVRGMLQTK